MSQANAFSSFARALFLASNAAFVAGNQPDAVMDEAQQLFDPGPEPYPSVRLHRLDQSTGLEAETLLQIDLRIPRALDEWTHITIQDTLIAELGFKAGSQSPRRTFVDYLNYQTSDNPSATGLMLRVELAGSRVWKPGSDGPDIRRYTCNLTIFYL